MTSIIIPCFNAAAYLSDAIVGACAEGCVDVVIVDDGSSDESLSIARSFEPSVRVLSGPNRGVSAARNLGIAESSGEWLIFLDADDQLLAQTVEERLATARKNPQADVVVCRWQELICAESSVSCGEIRAIDSTAIAANAEVAIAAYLWAPPAALMYRRSLVEKIGGFRLDLPVVEDARFLFDAAYHCARFAFSDHVGALYRIQPNSLSRRSPVQFWECVLQNGAQIEALWRARGELTQNQREALAGLYNNAVRGLFCAESPRYFEALERQRALGAALPRHSRITPPIARTLGLRSARRLFALVGR